LTLSGRLDYIVEWKAVVAPTYAEALAPTAKPTLTLITCFPFRYVGPAPKRFIVRALAVSPPEQTIPLMPKAISTAAPVD
jgi:sortase A